MCVCVCVCVCVCIIFREESESSSSLSNPPPFSVLYSGVSFLAYIFIILLRWVSVFKRFEGRVQEIYFSLIFQYSIFSLYLCLSTDSWKFNLCIFEESLPFPARLLNQFFVMHFGPLETNILLKSIQIISLQDIYISVIE